MKDVSPKKVRNCLTYMIILNYYMSTSLYKAQMYVGHVIHGDMYLFACYGLNCTLVNNSP